MTTVTQLGSMYDVMCDVLTPRGDVLSFQSHRTSIDPNCLMMAYGPLSSVKKTAVFLTGTHEYRQDSLTAPSVHLYPNLVLVLNNPLRTGFPPPTR